VGATVTEHPRPGALPTVLQSLSHPGREWRALPRRPRGGRGL